MKIVLGTVQFGLEYGVANLTGRVEIGDVINILQQAAAHGVDTLDTAIAYGDSESTLGQANVIGWNVVTKLPPLPLDCADVASWVNAQIGGSLKRLGVSQLYGVLLHHPMQLLGAFGKQLLDALLRLKAEGITRKIGVSVYSPEELSTLIDLIPCDLVQAPLNILDRRLVDSGWAKRLGDQDIEIHVRSVFLQGLLLLPPNKRPTKFSRFNSIWSEWSRWIDETKLTPLQACLGYVLGVDQVAKVVVGIDSISQLKEILAVSPLRLSNLPSWEQPIDMNLINPSRWSQL